MGRKKFAPVQVKGDFNIRQMPGEKPDLEKVVWNNPGLLEAVAKKNAAAFSIKSAYADFYPELSGSAGASKVSSSWPAEKSIVSPVTLT